MRIRFIYRLFQLLGITLSFSSCYEPAFRIPWINLEVDPAFQFFSQAHFFDENTGFVIARRSDSFQQVVLKTTDGGTTWTDHLTPGISGFNQIFSLKSGLIYCNGHFPDSSDLGSSIELFKSHDVGETWEHIAGNFREHPGGFFFWDDDNGILLNDSAFVTSDGGMNWFKLLPSGGVPPRGSLPLFTNRLRGFTSGGGSTICITFPCPAFSTGFIQMTEDGGHLWKDISNRVRPNLSRITEKFFVDEQIGFLFTETLEIFQTRDGGKTWVLVNSDLPVIVASAVFFDLNEGYVAGNNIVSQFGQVSGIFHTWDGGKTWRQEYLQNSSPVVDLAFPTKNVGYLITSNQVLKKVGP